MIVRRGREPFHARRLAEGRVLLGRMKVGHAMEKEQLLGVLAGLFWSGSDLLLGPYNGP